MFDQITAREFEDGVDRHEDGRTVVDTRPEDSYESWHVPGAVNLPFGPTETLAPEQEARIDRLAGNDSIVTICGKGATSTTLAAELDANGYDDVAVVKGGMRDWNSLYERADVDADDGRIIQFQRRGKGCLSYLVAAPAAGEAVLVDPTRHVDQYVVAAAELGVDVTRVLDTHVHADHISGGRRLADRLDVPYHLGTRAAERDPAYDFDAVADGDVIRVGDVAITVQAAPGHTSELVTYRVDDEALLTGDALFVDSVGRTELEFGEEGAERGAEMQYETLHDTLLAQSDDLTVLPGHVGLTSDGRFEHASPGSPVSASLGEIRRRLDLAGLDRDAFVDRMVDTVSEKPDNYETIIDVNLGRGSIESSREATQLETGSNNCSA
jgi:glyoxylase-like metal-dependent hydrolase (beta-lactamase superfamily II)